MKKQTSALTDTQLLRQKAEDLYKTNISVDGALTTESDVLKLNHELSVYQIELEIQNEELLKIKEELEVTVEKYTDLYDFAPTGYLTLSGEGQIVGLNFCASKMLGVERRRVIGTRLVTYLTDVTKQKYYSFLKDIFETEVEQSCEVTISVMGRSLIYVYLIGIVVKGGKNCDISMVDISERKFAEEKLTETNKELEHSLNENADKDLFISVLAHDLRNPFGTLLGFTELLIKDIHTHDTDYVEKLSNEIYNSAHSAYSLLEDLLKWSRIRTGGFPFDPQKISFQNICEDAVNFLTPIALRKEIIINCCENEDINIVADGEMLKAILRNLVSNAIKFTNNKGVIKISAKQYKSEVIISVSDNGIGIEPGRIARLFDLSKRSSTTGTANEGGTGLGLILCKEFVEKHGGKLSVESEPGTGSVFSFNIPTNPESSLINLVSTPENEGRINDLKILIVDDNSGLRMLLGVLVQNYSKETLYAESGDEAIRIFKKNPDIDLILMDYYMPNMTGSEAIRLIRLFNRNVIIIMVTTNELTDVLEESSREGIDDFFFKPFNRTFLNTLIIKHFKGRKNRSSQN